MTSRVGADAGLVAVPGAGTARLEWLRLVSLTEIIGVYTLLLWVAWTTRLNPLYDWFQPALAALIAYFILVSPIWHYFVERHLFLAPGQRDPVCAWFAGRGLGMPWRFFVGSYAEPALIRTHWRAVLLTVCVLTVIATLAVVHRHQDIAAAWDIDGGLGLVLLAALPMALLIAVLVCALLIRWDNLRAALPGAARIAGVGAVVLAVAAVLLNHASDLPLLTDISAAEKWARWSLPGAAAQWLAYLPWAYLQQILFLAVIAVQLARIFDVQRETGLNMAAAFTALLFGLVHLPNVWLWLYTTAMGFFLARHYLVRRNLFVLAAAHALLATLYYQWVPLSMAPEIDDYDGAPTLYFTARAAAFVAPVLALWLGSWVLGPRARRVGSVVALGLAVLVAWAYPSGADGPAFQWGQGNGRSWRLVNDLRYAGRGDGFTEFAVTGDDPHMVSSVLGLAPAAAAQVEVELELEPGSDQQVEILFDTGAGFNPLERIRIPYTAAQRRYRMASGLTRTLWRARLDPSARNGSRVRLYAVRFKPAAAAGGRR